MQANEFEISLSRFDGKGINPTVSSLLEGLRGLGGINEIPPGFNNFYPLPLLEPLRGRLFMTCPAGIAVTDQRLWISHSPFSDPKDAEYLWASWSRLEQTIPRHLLAFGQLSEKVEKVSRAMMDRTLGGSVNKKVIYTKGVGIYTLHIIPEQNSLKIQFIENDQISGGEVLINLEK